MSIRHAIATTLKEILQTAAISMAIFLFVYVFLVQPNRIRGDSMLPNFFDGELILTEKISYKLYKPARGDVIVFRAPTSRNVDFIKRIVGLPQETVRVEDGVVFVNDEKLIEPYEPATTQGRVEVRLGEGEYYVLGDNRGSSSDSRSFGPIEAKTIKGRAWIVYWPILSTGNSRGLRTFSRVDYGIPDTFDDR